MGLFKKKKKITKILNISMPTLIREAIFDSIFDDVAALSASMGLPPISDEVADMEEQASQKRLERFSNLLPLIEAHADIAARIAASAYELEMLGEHPESKPLIEEDLIHIIELFKIVSLSSSISVISTLINLDLLETGVKDE
jgi:hypothetical protein